MDAYQMAIIIVYEQRLSVPDVFFFLHFVYKNKMNEFSSW